MDLGHSKLAKKPKTGKPDMTGFARDMGGLTGPQTVSLLYGDGDVQFNTPPNEIPWTVLDLMGWDMVIYLGEMALAAPICDPSLYFIQHEDRKVVNECEAWLREAQPDLFRKLLRICSRALAWGVYPYVFDWERAPLRVRSENPRGRSTVHQLHQHYCAVHPVNPADAQLELDATGTCVSAVKVNNHRYGDNRAFASIWDDEYGEFFGRGSRRRAFPAWFDSHHTEVWFKRWLERSVDPPRVGYAPPGDLEINGVKLKASALLDRAMISLKGGGATTLPATIDDISRDRLWDIKVMDLPDRSETWHKALDRFDSRKLLACLVPPTSVGVEDAILAGARVPAQQFVEFAQLAADFLAQEVSKVVAVCHSHYRRKESEAPPRVIAHDLPIAKRKVLLEVFRTVASTVRHIEGGKVVTLAEQVSDDLLDELGIQKISAAEAAHEPMMPQFGEPGGGPPGRNKDTTSDREDRRDRARSDEGEDATGGRDESPSDTG